jgi:phosphohistidine phosphatase SixA
MIVKRIPSKVPVVASLVLAVLLLHASSVPADESDVWNALAQDGLVALIRHGNAPPGYGGDPPGFRIDDCTTQRNMDDKGRAQSKALGEAFREHRVRVDRIAASPVCRCQETAQLMAVGPVETSWALVPNRGENQRRLQALKEMVSSWKGPGTLVLVSHGEAIKPLVGLMPMQSEIVVLKPAPGSPDGGLLVGTIGPQ